MQEFEDETTSAPAGAPDLSNDPLLPGIEEDFRKLQVLPPPPEDAPPPPPPDAPHRGCAGGRLAALLALAFVLGLGVGLGGAACLFRAPPPDGMPLTLLPSDGRAAWRVVSEMSGDVDGVPLKFHRGLAEGKDGRIRHVALDFCRGTDECFYARVMCGAATRIVRVDAQGHILRDYQDRNGARPLKALFGR